MICQPSEQVILRPWPNGAGDKIPHAPRGSLKGAQPLHVVRLEHAGCSPEGLETGSFPSCPVRGNRKAVRLPRRVENSLPSGRETMKTARKLDKVWYSAHFSFVQ